MFQVSFLDLNVTSLPSYVSPVDNPIFPLQFAEKPVNPIFPQQFPQLGMARTLYAKISESEKRLSLSERVGALMRVSGKVLANLLNYNPINMFANMSEDWSDLWTGKRIVVLYGSEFLATKIAADKGISEAQYKVGCRYYEGQGVEKSYTEALKYFRLAATQGNPEAQYKVGCLYYKGQGVEKSYTKALEYFRLAATQGNPEAQYKVGCLYYKGKGVEKSYTEALKYFHLAGKQDNVHALNAIGLMYYKGEGVAQLNTIAVQYFRRAAEKGSVQALCNLGMIDYNDNNKEAKLRAINNFKNATQKETNKDAIYHIGLLHDEKILPNSSTEKAINHYKYAFEHSIKI